MSYEELKQVEEEVYQYVKSMFPPPGSKPKMNFLNLPLFFEEKLSTSVEEGTIALAPNEKGEGIYKLTPKGKRITAFGHAFKEYAMKFMPEGIKEIMTLFDAQYVIFRAYSAGKRLPEKILKDPDFIKAYAKYNSS